MHIIESGDLAKPVATLSPLTKLSGNDAYYSTYWDKNVLLNCTPEGRGHAPPLRAGERQQAVQRRKGMIRI